MSGIDRRKSNQEMWDRKDVKPIDIISRDETNDDKIAPVFDIQIGDHAVMHHRYKAAVIYYLENNLDKIHEQGYNVTLIPKGII